MHDSHATILCPYLVVGLSRLLLKDDLVFVNLRLPFVPLAMPPCHRQLAAAGSEACEERRHDGVGIRTGALRRCILG